MKGNSNIFEINHFKVGQREPATFCFLKIIKTNALILCAL